MNIKKESFTRQRSQNLLLMLVAGGLFAIPIAAWAAFSQPVSHPPAAPGYTYQPGDNIYSPIQGNILDQTKLGSLLIGEKNGSVISRCSTGDTSGCSVLCLNGNPYLGTTDATHCISSWSQLTALAGSSGPFVRLFGANSTSLDSGYFNVVGTNNSADNIQLVSVITEGYSGAGPSNSGALKAEAYADSNFAGEFFGSLVIDGPYNASGTKIYPGQLCLNDSLGGSNACITSWSDILSLNGKNTIRLQDVHLTTASPDIGNASAVGPFEATSVVMGQPQSGLPVVYSCGDGICSSSNGETNANCSADCEL